MRQFARFAIVAAVVVSAARCSSTAPSTPVPFTRLASFPIVNPGSSVFSGQQVIRDTATWATAWSGLTNTITPHPLLPQVDFTTSVVIFTSMGKQPSGGYQTFVSAVTSDHAGHALVAIEQTVPGSNCAVTAAVTTPTDAVTISRDAASSVDFKVTHSVHQCG